MLQEFVHARCAGWCCADADEVHAALDLRLLHRPLEGCKVLGQERQSWQCVCVSVVLGRTVWMRKPATQLRPSQQLLGKDMHAGCRRHPSSAPTPLRSFFKPTRAWLHCRAGLVCDRALSLCVLSRHAQCQPHLLNTLPSTCSTSGTLGSCVPRPMKNSARFWPSSACGVGGEKRERVTRQGRPTALYAKDEGSRTNTQAWPHLRHCAH